MHIHKLKLTNFRGLYNTEFLFHPNFNLIVGINGAGKTSVLDAIRILISQISPQITLSPRYSLGFEENDIMFGQPMMSANIGFDCHGIQFDYTVQKNREQFVVNKDKDEQLEKVKLRNQTTSTPDKSILTANINPIPFKQLKKKDSQPIAVYFSTRRSWASEERSNSPEGIKAAYYKALTIDRGLRIQDFVDWWKIKEAFSIEVPNSKSNRQLQAVIQALEKFMPSPHYSNWRLEGDKVYVTKYTEISIFVVSLLKRGELSIHQLSEGERSLIVLVFELARRLAQANPESDDPISTGEGIVLIDELDLHLHPTWQRKVVHDLKRTFPKIQFFATTHSPQIIGEVQADEVILLRNGGTEKQSQTFGMDSNWVLKHIMGGADRNAEVATKLDTIFELIEEDNFNEARKLIDALRAEIGEHPSLVRAETIIDRYTRIGE